MFGWDEGLGLVRDVIGRVWPDPSKKMEFEQKMAELEATGELQKLMAQYDLAKGQLAVNAEEAKHESISVSGWRPFIGWVCGAAYAYHFIIQPLITYFCRVAGKVIDVPVFDMDALSTVLFGMLGLGVYRTAEKITTKIVNKKGG